MATITITITESPLQLLAGIPSSVTLDTNVPSTVFYTLDGTEPTTDSDLALEAIEMPTDSSKVVLKAFATDGVDSSATITQEYSTNVVPARQPHDTVSFPNASHNKATFPFGSSAQAGGPTAVYGNTGGVIVDDNDETRVSTGFGGDGYEVGFVTGAPENFDTMFSETDEIGQYGHGIGTLPGRVLYSKPRNDNTVVEHSNTASPLFDAKAMVIFQDSREEQHDPDIPRINRPYFDLEDQAKARDGSMLTITDAITPSGGFLKAHFNPTENTLTYYYYDNRVGRWIISKEPYSQSQNPTANMSGIVSRSSRGEGAGKVFKWIPFKYRALV